MAHKVKSDHSHASVSIYFPGTGRVNYDPTNACYVATGHMVVARGRVIFDVRPVKSLFSGDGGQSLETGVTVEPVKELR